MRTSTRFALIAALAVALLTSSLDLAADDLEVFKGCGLTGTAKSACGQKLNGLKNRAASPSEDEINADISLDAMLEPGDDLSRWETSDAAQVTGIVASVIPGGKQESCNCGRKDLRDIHINIVLDEADVDEPTRYVIAEITPRMQHLHPQ